MDESTLTPAQRHMLDTIRQITTVYAEELRGKDVFVDTECGAWVLHPNETKPWPTKF